ncbi:MAG: hypothetical protein IKR00_03620 [Lachnospiraceae bacterium]|nr:hypothetical protein [Lachnospiraceae bacterium]
MSTIPTAVFPYIQRYEPEPDWVRAERLDYCEEINAMKSRKSGVSIWALLSKAFRK